MLKKHFCYFWEDLDLGNIGFANFGAQIPPPALEGPKLLIEGFFKTWNMIFM